MLPHHRMAPPTSRPFLAGALTVVASLFAAPQAPAQSRVELDEPVAAAARPFSSVAGLREMPDGTLLVADGLEGTLLRVSADLATASPVGREGAGPDEYRTPDGLFAISPDSTLVVDLGNGRLVVLGPDAAISRTFPIAGGSGPRPAIRIPGAVDAAGRIYFRRMGAPGPGGPPDSGTVARYDPAADETADLASVRMPALSRRESGGAGERSVQMRPVPLSPEDAWTATSDGRLVVARQSEGAYWLEILGGESGVRGPDIAYEPHPVRGADRDAWIAALSGALGVTVEEENGRRRMSFGRGDAPALEADDLQWPETKPAFRAGGLSVASDGNFWLERHVTAGEPRRFDVLDGSGRRIGVVRLPEGRRLAGFGEEAVYLTRSDELDFTWLERYALPAF